MCVCVCVLTFHKDKEGLSEDVCGGEEHQYGEEEGAYRVGHLPGRLKRGETHTCTVSIAIIALCPLVVL